MGAQELEVVFGCVGNSSSVQKLWPQKKKRKEKRGGGEEKGKREQERKEEKLVPKWWWEGREMAAIFVLLFTT